MSEFVYFPLGFPTSVLKDSAKLSVFKCRECGYILHIPMQRLTCGHRMCLGCYKQIQSQIEKDGQAECKQCEHPIIDAQSNQFFEDLGFKKDFGAEEMYCPFPGCGETVRYKALDKHIVQCPRRPVQCTNQGCAKEVQECELDQHMQNECPYRIITCHACNKTMLASRVQYHEKFYCYQENMAGNSWAQSCPFLCPPPAEGWTKESLEKHRAEAVLEHIDRAWVQIQRFQNSLQNSFEFPMDLVVDKEDKDTATASASNSLPSTSSTSAVATDPTSSPENFYRAILNSDPDRLLRLLFVFDKNFAEIFRMPLAFREMKSAYEILLNQLLLFKRSDAMKSAEIERLRQQMDEAAEASYNGVMIWRIDKWESVRDKAVKRIQQEIRSPVFYTSKFGYKLQLILYPNGSNSPQAWNKYLSLYLMVCPGKYDPLLKFPFRQRTTFTLEDQDMQLPIMDSVIPTIQVNHSQGADLFMKLEHLSKAQYVKNDCIFIRCIVDCANLFNY